MTDAKTFEFNSLKGKTLKAVRQEGEDILEFVTSGNAVYRLYHSQDCCEYVRIEEIIGDLSDLIETPILLAEEVVSQGATPEGLTEPSDESYTWTFYKLSTLKGSVTIRWYGSSNGYYSERVNFWGPV